MVSHLDVIHGCLNCQIWWTWVGQPRIHARSMKFRQKLEKINLKVPFDSNNYFLRFDRKCVLHNQDEKLVSCSSMNWEKFVKTGFMQKSLSKSHFRKLLQVLLIFTNLFESKIFVGKQNSWIQFQSSHFSQNRSDFHSNTSSLDLQS